MSQKGKNLGPKHGRWAGDKVGYGGLHSWVRRNLKKPKDSKCQVCHIAEIFEVVNSDNTYTRDLRKWKWSCRFCHMFGDGRFANLTQSQGKTERQIRMMFSRA